MSWPNRLIRRLHDHDRGHLAIMALFLLLVMWAQVGLIWNTGAVVADRIEAQTAADTAATSAATWLARTTNSAANTNRVIFRTGSAECLTLAAPLTAIMIVVNWIQAIEEAGYFAAIVALEIIANELPTFIEFVSTTVPVLADFWDMWDRIQAVHDFQVDLFEATPEVIDQQRELLEGAYGARIVLSRPGVDGPGLLNAPIEEGDFFSALFPLSLQVLRDSKGWKDALQPIQYGKGPTEWMTWTSAMIPLIAFQIRNQHDVLITQSWVLEHPPDDDERLEHFSVIAAASIPGLDSSERSLPGLFRTGVRSDDAIVAVAQAEVFNALDKGLFFDILPWRLSTARGAHWQSRLTALEALVPALEVDPSLRELLHEGGIDEASYDDVERILAH